MHLPSHPALQPATLVIDTNVVLDLFVFDDPCAAAVRADLRQGHVRWYATQAMRDELARVLGYPAIALWLQRTGQGGEAVLAQFDAHATRVPEAPAVPVRCKDADDQKFIDLAVQQRAVLLSKDKAVLRLTKRLQASGVRVARTLE